MKKKAPTKTSKGPKGHTAHAEITVNVPVGVVWHALVTPALIKQYMFGAEVISDWKEHSPIIWKGEYQGKKYEDKGLIKKIHPEKNLTYSHFSPLEGSPDLPENYHTVSITLTDEDTSTGVELTQDNNATEASKEQSSKNWQQMLDELKKLLEK